MRPSEKPDGLLRKLKDTLRAASRRQTVEQDSDEGDFRQLPEVGPAERFSDLAQEGEIHGRRRCAQLLTESRSLLPADSVEAERLAQLALFLAERLDPDSVPTVVIFDYQAQAWNLMGEARTTGGDLQGASMALQLAGCLLSGGSGDVGLQASFLKAKARLYRARGEEELARRADHRARLMAEALDFTRVCS